MPAVFRADLGFVPRRLFAGLQNGESARSNKLGRRSVLARPVYLDTDSVVFTIQRAIKQKLIQKADRQTLAEVNRRWKDDKEKQEGGIWWLIVGTLIVVVVVIILIEHLFPALF